MAKKVKLTVLRRELYSDLVEKYSDGKSVSEKCGLFTDGQVIMIEDPNLAMPEGFCSWAWADLHREIAAMYHGADYFWSNKKGSIVACCTDGFRPVVFLIERIEE